MNETEYRFTHSQLFAVLIQTVGMFMEGCNKGDLPRVMVWIEVVHKVIEGLDAEKVVARAGLVEFKMQLPTDEGRAADEALDEYWEDAATAGDNALIG